MTETAANDLSSRNAGRRELDDIRCVSTLMKNEVTDNSYVENPADAGSVELCSCYIPRAGVWLNINSCQTAIIANLHDALKPEYLFKHEKKKKINF